MGRDGLRRRKTPHISDRRSDLLSLRPYQYRFHWQDYGSLKGPRISLGSAAKIMKRTVRWRRESGRLRGIFYWRFQGAIPGEWRDYVAIGKNGGEGSQVEPDVAVLTTTRTMRPLALKRNKQHLWHVLWNEKLLLWCFSSDVRMPSRVSWVRPELLMVVESENLVRVAGSSVFVFWRGILCRKGQVVKGLHEIG